MKAKEIFDLLNEVDEQGHIEAKSGSGITDSVLETVCAYANEPNLGGGYILIGAKEDSESLFPQYIVDEIKNPDKMQSDLASQCAVKFNIAIRPKITIEQINNKNVAVIKVNELDKRQKPLFFKKYGLPNGAYRRIGPTDHRCTEDDLPIFYNAGESYDASIVDYTSISDIDENAIKRYRSLREKLNPAAEELTYGDEELLQSLGCMVNDKSGKLSAAGLLLFGKSSSLRRVFPLHRVDYIRVPGNEWVSDPDSRFTTIDMRGSLLLLVFRVVDAIYSDLPKGFRLEENDLQADSVGIPVKALREAITNALMHRSYRINEPIQIIRYDNRLEILNPGFSLKSEENLGTPGSVIRNPFVAAVFHETNLAETKGSGIRAMRKMMIKSNLAPPTFESNRINNKFTARLLLLHLLRKKDIEWLSEFSDFNLTDYQKQALVFVREVGAIDNNTYRQLSDTDSVRASIELRQLRELDLLVQKGKGRGTYYIMGTNLESKLKNDSKSSNTEGKVVNTEGRVTNTEGSFTNTEVEIASELIKNIDSEVDVVDPKQAKLIKELPEHVRLRISKLKKREGDPDKIKNIIEDICEQRAYSIGELATILEKQENWLSRTYIRPLINENRITYTIPDMIPHPNQKYIAVN